MTAGEDFAGSFPAAVPSRVRPTLRGEPRESTVLHPLGDVENPLSDAQLAARLRDLSRGIPSLDPARLTGAVAALDEEGPSPLLAALAGDI